MFASIAAMIRNLNWSTSPTASTSAAPPGLGGADEATTTRFLMEAQLAADPTHDNVRDENNFKAGKLPNCAAFWSDHLLPNAALPPEKSATILRWVSAGVSVTEFIKPTDDAPWPTECRMPNHPIDTDDSGWVSDEIRRCLASGAIREVKSKPHLVMPLGVAHQATKRRLIYDARHLNRWTPSPDMQYQTLRSFQRNLRQGDLMFSLDHKSGYHHVPLTPDSWTMFGFEWAGRYYVYTVLPFGWAPACYIYDTLSSVVAAYIARMGIVVIHYLDDFGLAIPARMTGSAARWAVWAVLEVMYLSGYFVSVSKSHLAPSTSLQLLGFVIDSAARTFAVPDRKMTALLDLLDSIIGTASEPVPPGTHVRYPALQSLLGKAQSMSLAIPPVSIFLRSTYDAIKTQTPAGSRTSKAHARRSIALPAEAIGDLAELRSLGTWTRLSRWPDERHTTLTLHTDACLTGWGGSLNDNGTLTDLSGVFPLIKEPDAIHIKEQLAIEYCINHLREVIRDCFLDIYTDNTIVQHTLLNGAALDGRMRAFSRALLQFQLDNNVVVRVHRVSTTANARADSLSRLNNAAGKASTPMTIDRSDHRLNPDLFRRVCSLLPTGWRLSIDACANALNRQLPRYVSLEPCAWDPPVAVNAFSYGFVRADGQPECIYCNPPWAIIQPLWVHFRQRHCHGVMIVPDMPTRPWFAAVTRDALRIVQLAPAGTRDVFFQPSRGYKASVGPVPWNVLAVLFDFRGRS